MAIQHKKAGTAWRPGEKYEIDILKSNDVFYALKMAHRKFRGGPGLFAQKVPNGPKTYGEKTKMIWL